MAVKDSEVTMLNHYVKTKNMSEIRLTTEVVLLYIHTHTHIYTHT
jgi:hypothetical protein